MTGFTEKLRGLERGDLLRQSVPASVVAVFAVLTVISPELLTRLAQEDSCVEWLSFAFFAAAGLVFSLAAGRLGFRKAWIVTAAAVFCFMVAGEEISWGQRLLGFLPPEAFLRDNYQQESNIHNILQPWLKPKWLVFSTLVFWGALLPALQTFPFRRFLRLPRYTEAMTIPLSFTSWALIGAVLLVSYPVDFTSEYVELLTGILFYLAASGQNPPPGQRAALIVLPLFIAASGYGFTELRARTGGERKLDCARKEVQALAQAICAGGVTDRLLDSDSLHKRMFTAMRSGYLRPGVAEALGSVSCPGIGQDPDRRRYLMDPWGQPYWVRYRHMDGQESETAEVYSFGPNRRRDSDTAGFGGTDDVGVRTPPINTGHLEQEDFSEADGQAVLE